MTVLPELPLAEYQFNFQVLQELRSSDFSGSLWHGVFGKALYESVCINRGSACEDCPFLHSCDYSLLFTAPRPLKTELMRHYQTIPVPHIIRVENLTSMLLFPKQIVSIRLIVIGTANQKLQLIIWALLKAGINGLGKNRSKLQLQEVWLHHPNALPRLIYQPPEIKAFPLPELLPIIAMPQQVTLRFISPYKQSGKTSNEGLDIPAFLMAIVRRVSLLQYFYTDKQLDADFKQLKVLVHALKVSNNQLVGQEQSRYSAKHRKMLDASGVLGSLELDLQGMEALWPYLYLGQWLNVGKNASMGFGCYQLLLV